MPAPDLEAGRSRPDVWVNCAISVDGRLAYAGGRRARLSGPEDLRRVQELRATSDGILVGAGTILLDDPSLRVHWEMLDRPPGSPPFRIVLDSNGRVPMTARIFDGSLPTILVTTPANTHVYPGPVEVLRTPGPRVDLVEALALLQRRGLRRVLVEGGAEVLSSVLRSGQWDRLTVYVAPVAIGGRTAPMMVAGPEALGPEDVVPMVRTSAAPLGEGTLVSYVPGPPAQRS
jgi:2,5-diamino-6-(ribosylamino)-4(3H)-pyrimidinone 5'-phosphate reductase